jgi:hypothetical protein
MNKKTSFALLLLLCIIVFSGCGPRRYGCGPRRCEVKTPKLPTLPQTLEKSTLRIA